MKARGLLLGGVLLAAGLACGDGEVFSDGGTPAGNGSGGTSGATNGSGGTSVSNGSGGAGGLSGASSGAGGDPSGTSSVQASTADASSSQVSSSSGGPEVCAPAPDDSPCVDCLKDQCCPQLVDCQASQNCSCWLNCLGDGGSQFDCFQMCGQPGMTFNALVGCAQNSCGNACQ